MNIIPEENIHLWSERIIKLFSCNIFSKNRPNFYWIHIVYFGDLVTVYWYLDITGYDTNNKYPYHLMNIKYFDLMFNI